MVWIINVTLHLFDTILYALILKLIFSPFFLTHFWGQCYDKYLLQSLRTAAKLRGHSFWARGPDNAGQYNSMPHETGFFCERGDYDNFYGRFFLHWYAQSLIDHADNVLSLANLAFEETKLIVKVHFCYIIVLSIVILSSRCTTLVAFFQCQR